MSTFKWTLLRKMNKRHYLVDERAFSTLQPSANVAVVFGHCFSTFSTNSQVDMRSLPTATVDNATVQLRQGKSVGEVPSTLAISRGGWRRSGIKTRKTSQSQR